MRRALLILLNNIYEIKVSENLSAWREHTNSSHPGERCLLGIAKTSRVSIVEVPQEMLRDSITKWQRSSSVIELNKIAS
jgi:hypothetical protein